MHRDATFTRVSLVLVLAGGLQAASQNVTPGLNRFSESMYGQLARGGRNLVLSPFSISGALSMALTGTRGATAVEIARVLGQGQPDASYHADLAALVKEITRTANSNGNRLLNANALWVQRNLRILPDFQNALQNVYDAVPRRVDFGGDTEGARSEINRWTERTTQGKIRDLFAPGSLNGRTRLVLSSAVYFYGKWERPFRRAETRPAPFTLPGGNTEQADFMHQTGGFGYAETASGQFLEMRYAGTGLAFDILLPKKGTPLESLAAGTNPDVMSGFLGALENRAVRVAIPKFRIESDFPLATVLESLGMATAFSSEADFSGIDDRRDLQLSQVVHKAYVDVAEEGTEAAAATGAGVALISMQMPPELEFRADRPFRFWIRDTRSGLILFAGRVMDPKR